MKVFSNTAIALDGRIATVSFDHVRLGSDEDLRVMSVLRAKAGAVLVGGRTFRNHPRPLIESARHIETERTGQVISAVLTRRGVADMVDPVRWKRDDVALWVFGGPDMNVAAHEAVGASVITTEQPTPGWVIGELAARGVGDVLVEGGGDLLFQLLDANLLDEVNVTVCPWFIGGVGAPSICDGRGFSPKEMRRLQLLDTRREGDELYLRYAVLKSA